MSLQQFVDLDRDPEFQSFSYQKQQEIRAEALKRLLPRDQGFSQLHPQVQGQVWNQLMSRPPALSERTQYTDRLSGLYQQAANNDQSALNQLTADVGGATFAGRAGPVYDLARGVGGVLARATDGKAFGDHGDAKDIEAMLGGPVRQTADESKYLEFLRGYLNSNENVSGAGRFLLNTAPFFGTAASISSGRVAMQGFLAALRPADYGGMIFNRGAHVTQATQAITGSAIPGIATAALSSKAGSIAPNLIRWMTSSILPEVAEATVDSVGLVWNTIKQNALETDLPKWLPQFESRLGKVAMNFGYEMAADLAFFTTANLLGSMLRQGFRVMSKVKTGMAGSADPMGKMAREVGDDEFANYMRYAFSGEDMPKEMFNSLSAESKRTWLNTRRMWAAADNLPNITKEDSARLVLGKNNFELNKVDGGYELLRGGNRVGNVYSNVDNAIAAAYKFDVEPALRVSAQQNKAFLDDSLSIEKSTTAKAGDVSNIRYDRDVIRVAEQGLNNEVITDTLVQDLAKRLDIPMHRVADNVFDLDGVRYAGPDALDNLSKRFLLSGIDTPEGLQTIQRTYNKQFGINIRQTETGFEARQGKEVLHAASDPKDILEELSKRGFTPKFDQAHAPQFVIDPEAKSITMIDGELHGPHDHIARASKQFFDDTPVSQLVKRFAGVDIDRDTVSTVYRVKANDLYISPEFKSFDEAKAFATSTFNTMEELRTLGLYKAVPDIQNIGGKIMARTVDDGNKVFDTLDQLSDYLKNKQAPAMWRKELSNMDPTMIDDVWGNFDSKLAKQAVGSVSPRDVKYNEIIDHVKQSWLSDAELSQLREAGNVGFYGVRKAGQDLWGSFTSQMFEAKYNTINRLAGSQGASIIKDSFESIEKSIKNARGLQNRIRVITEALNRTPGVSEKRMIQLGALLEVPDAKWTDVAKNLNIDLSQSDLTYLKRYREVSSNLGQMFGIDATSMWTNYLPRIRGYYMTKEGREAAAVTGNGLEFMKNALGGMNTKEAKFFAEHLRTKDIVQWLGEVNPNELLNRYAMTGAKNVTIGKTYNEVHKSVNEMYRAGVLSDEGMHTLAYYLQDVMGSYTDQASVIAMKTAQKMSDTLTEVMLKFDSSAQAKVATRDMISTFQGFTIAATMAFRPWLPIRNMMQVWTTLAGHFGNSTIMRGLKKMNNVDELQKRVMHLRNTGRLQTQANLFELTGLATQDQKGLIKRFFNKFGMAPYKTSDEYTRVVVDYAVNDVFESAAKQFSIDGDAKKFLKLSNLDRFDSADQQRVVQLLRDQGYTSALDYYGDFVTRETMFAYTPGSNPAMFQGHWGRLFGTFGHYPVYFAQNIRNGLRRGNLIHKAQFATRTAFNMAALWFTFEKVLGIRGDAFRPDKTMFFDGGPYFKLMTRAMSAVKGGPSAPSMGQVLDEARRVVVPGSLAWRGFMTGIDSLQKGDTYEAILNFMSVPTAD